MKRSRWTWPRVAFCLIVAGVVAVYVPDSPDREIARLRHSIAANLPPGSSRLQIEQWLSGHGFAVHEVHQVGDKEGRIPAIYSSVDRQYVWYSGELQLWFELTGDGSLGEAKIEWFEYSL